MNIVSDDYDGQMILGDECSPNFLTFFLELRKTLNQKPKLGPLRETLSLDHKGAQRNNRGQNIKDAHSVPG